MNKHSIFPLFWSDFVIFNSLRHILIYWIVLFLIFLCSFVSMFYLTCFFLFYLHIKSCGFPVDFFYMNYIDYDILIFIAIINGVCNVLLLYFDWKVVKHACSLSVACIGSYTTLNRDFLFNWIVQKLLLSFHLYAPIIIFKSSKIWIIIIIILYYLFSINAFQVCLCIFSIREENVFNSPRNTKGVNSLMMNVVNTVH